MAKGNRARSHAHRIYDDDPPRCAGCNWEMALIEPMHAWLFDGGPIPAKHMGTYCCTNTKCKHSPGYKPETP